MDGTLILSLAVGGASAIAYGAAYYRHRQCRAALGNQSEQLALAPRNAEKWERLVPFATLGVVGVAAVQAYSKGWEVLVQGFAHACFPHFFGEVQRLAQQLWISNTGFVYTLNFVPWTQIESIMWDNDIGQQSYGVQFRYTLKGRKKTLKLWIPRDRKTECVRTLAKYMNLNTAENLLAHDEQ